ncbi:MAG TPA: RNA polymerase sigma-70 factor [Flavipsychrobacter sp.]|nr:RNA polymerase sigma-70 factor [Flavipsychrobacter sp.]
MSYSKKALQAIIFDSLHVPLSMQESRMTTTLSVHTQFEQVFKSHFRRLHAYAYTLLSDQAMAEEMVQNVFCKLWEKNKELIVEISITAYLYRAVHNECLNHIKHSKVKSAYNSYMAVQGEGEDAPTQKLALNELEKNLDKALRDLPEQCRAIFQMSRFEGLKYREIADRMNLSVKTIENQMGKALKILRLKLADHLPATLLFFLLMN